MADIEKARSEVVFFSNVIAARKAAHDAEAVKEAAYAADMASFQKSLDDAKAEVAEIEKP